MIDASSDPTQPTVSVVIAARNEARNLTHLFARLPADIHEVIVVDGQSVDGTVDVARRLRSDVRIIAQTRNGKGDALASGYAAATGDVVATLDADGSADPAAIPRLVDALRQPGDFAKGTRFAADGADVAVLRRIGNRLLGGVANRLYGTRYSDLCCGFNVFWRRHVPGLDLDATMSSSAACRGLRGDGVEIGTLINLRAAKAGLAVIEVPIDERARSGRTSNLSLLRDGIRVLRTIVAERGHRPSPAAAAGTRPATRPAVGLAPLQPPLAQPAPPVIIKPAAAPGQHRGSLAGEATQ